MSQVLNPVTHNYPFAFAGKRPIMDPKERFYRQFQFEVQDIQTLISKLGSISIVGGERKDATDSILMRISKLSLDVADASDFIPAYDQRTQSAAIKSLTDQLNEEVARLAPAKPRFQFKRAPRTVAAPPAGSTPAAPDNRLLRGVPDKPVAKPEETADAAATEAEASDAVGTLPVIGAGTAVGTKNYNAEIGSTGGKSGSIRKPSFSSAREIAISGHTGLHIILPLSASRATAYGSLTDLHNCVVDMSVPTSSTARGGGGAAFQSLMLRDIEHSLVVAGHVSGAVHITGLKNCVLVVAARQVRIHECDGVDVYLQCGSRPIIEDCRHMRFAPLPQPYANDGSSEATNQWDQVDDFKWLRSDASPNWSVLPEAERLPDTVWTGAVTGGPGLSTADVLRAVGIAKK
ncbi:hypothetical protein HMPREF1624_01012 [Sporothrix schenckii ATCC 58251]|uniref:C-CAP/cofactor C-like domain-containing protein n=1 Tax=Sporothrix schenckii (strain ATCC 58251 / de Perez 2211183) TaxID=1391915 RepID=U7Q7J8_SPOS1|nr:hypothetical protein HMPREF1624_01012 [Sporothrix schenckii ATCC 58251]